MGLELPRQAGHVDFHELVENEEQALQVLKGVPEKFVEHAFGQVREKLQTPLEAPRELEEKESVKVQALVVPQRRVLAHEVLEQKHKFRFFDGVKPGPFDVQQYQFSIILLLGSLTFYYFLLVQ